MVGRRYSGLGVRVSGSTIRVLGLAFEVWGFQGCRPEAVSPNHLDTAQYEHNLPVEFFRCRV